MPSFFYSRTFPCSSSTDSRNNSAFPIFCIRYCYFNMRIASNYDVTQLKTKLRCAFKKPKTAKLAVLLLWLCTFSLFAFPFGKPLLNDFNSVSTGFNSERNIRCAQSPNDAYAATNYVNSHTNSNDFVIASPQISWLLHCSHTNIETIDSSNPRSCPFLSYQYGGFPVCF